MLLNNFIRPRIFPSIINYYQHAACVRLLSMESEMDSASWRGVPLSEIIGSQSPWGAPEFPLITPSQHHTVLYHVSSNGYMGDRPPKPHTGHDKWDSEFVRLPCSSKSLYPVEDSNGETHLRKRWAMIEEALRKPIQNSQQLAEAIVSYNIKFKSIWKFKALHALFNDHLDEEVSEYFFTATLPQIAKLALDLPKLIQCPIPLLKQHKNHSISLSQQQIASLLANAFFCTFPRRNTNKRSSEYASYSHINFSALYECHPDDVVLEKLTCLCHYFRRVCTKVPAGVATFSRRSVSPRALPAWPASRAPLATLPLHVDPAGKIEDAHGLVQLDFANKYLGGGVLGHGSVQEEIRFVISPEHMVSMLFTEVLRPNEALLMIGCERYSDYTGYGRSFRWAGNHEDAAPRDSSGRRRVALLAIDALPHRDSAREYLKESFTRELNKAWVGFSFFSSEQSPVQYPGVASGNWGCGAFGGDPALKSLLQLLACAEARRPIAYYTFGDTGLRDQILNVHNLLARHDVTVGQVYQYLVQFSEARVGGSQLYAYLQQALVDEQNRRAHGHAPARAGASPRTRQQAKEPIQQELRNDSPDLFSQDEVPSQQADPQLYQLPDLPSSSGTTTPMNTTTTDKTNDNKLAPQTKRLFDELQKFDEDNGKLNLNSSTNEGVTSRYFDGPKSVEDILKSSDSEIELNDVSMASSSRENTPISKISDVDKMADSENKMVASSSRLIDEMQKLDEHGRLNLTVPSTPSLLNTKHAPLDSDMDSDKSDVEVKKKIARKITDYFSKKST